MLSAAGRYSTPELGLILFRGFAGPLFGEDVPFGLPCRLSMTTKHALNCQGPFLDMHIQSLSPCLGEYKISWAFVPCAIPAYWRRREDQRGAESRNCSGDSSVVVVVAPRAQRLDRHIGWFWFEGELEWNLSLFSGWSP